MEEGMDIHPCVLHATTSLVPVGSDKAQRRVNVVQGDGNRRRIDRPSFDYLVNFLGQTRAHPVTELVLDGVLLCLPLDGGLDVLSDFLTNDARTLTKVGFVGCDLGGTVGLQLLLGSFRTNTKVKELQLSNCKIADEDLSCLVEALEGNTALEVLDLSDNLNLTSIGVKHITRIISSTRLKKIKFGAVGVDFNVKGVAKRFAHVLRRNKFLQSLEIDVRSLPGSAAAMMFRALEVNTTLEELLLGRLISFTQPECVVDQLIESLPRMKGIKRLALDDWDFFVQNNALLSALNKNASLQDLPGINEWPLPGQRATVAAMNNVLARNRSLPRVDFLLAPQPKAGVRIDDNSGLWDKAIVKLAKSADNGSHVGASAIFKILRAQIPLLIVPHRQPSVS
jgi:hypothetical protein